MSKIGVLGEGLAELTVEPPDDDDGHGGGAPAIALGFGGDAANVAVMAARAGAAVRLCGRTGDDALGDALRAFWNRQGVDVTAVARDPSAATGVYVNEDDPRGGHRFVYWRRGSAGSRLHPGDVTDAFLAGLAIVAVTGVTLSISASARAAAERAAQQVRARGGRVAFVVNHRPALDPPVAALVAFARGADVVIGSREDFAAVIDPTMLAGDRREVVITDGGRPATVLERDGTRHVLGVPPTTVVNAAGAGDALAGAYLAARLTGAPPPAALRAGVTAASLSVGRAGCARSYPTAGELAAALAS